jgi:putative transposase
VTLGGRRVAVKRPRVRTADGESEISLGTYEHFADRDLLGRAALERILAGVWTRKYRRCQEPAGEQTVRRERSTSKSSVSPMWTFLDDLGPVIDGYEALLRATA